MKTTPQKPGKPAEMKPTKTDELAEADYSLEECRSTPKCRENLRVLNNIFESMESPETFQPKDDANSH